jgi:meso-butanediol dehydrogenase / (S,S)-butanediol dehydrogenase / diacetyl reductase
MDTTRVALVTGAARGIGLATAKAFVSEGWQVALLDRDRAALMQATEEVPGALALSCDVSDPAQVQAAVDQALSALGRLDALVNNAGVALFEPLEQCDFTKWRTVMSTNLDGVFLMSQATIPALKATKGAIVNIASISGLRASTLRVAYGTSKAAVIHLTRQQAAELGEYGIRANCVAPGPVRTQMSMDVHSPEIISAYVDTMPLGRFALDTEIADAIVYLCSDRASFVTGQVLAVDGGFQSTGVGLPALRRGRE